MLSIGIDIGGTNIAGGIVSGESALTQKLSIPFPGPQAPYASIDVCVEVIQKLLAEAGLTIADIDAIGFAVPGQIDYATGGVVKAANLGYYDFPLKRLIHERLPETSVYVENDANAAALAEYYFGAFRGHASGLLITLGTGVGGGMILDHKLFIGGRKNGFEIGHMMLQFGGEGCTCGNLGCFEAYCSASALIRDGKRAAASVPDCLIANRARDEGKRIDAKLILDCAREGDPTALALFHDYVEHLGAGIQSAVTVLDPEIVALGGGVSNAGAFLIDPVNEYVREHVFFVNYAGRVVAAQLGNDAGIIGAAMLHKQAAASGAQ